MQMDMMNPCFYRTFGYCITWSENDKEIKLIVQSIMGRIIISLYLEWGDTHSTDRQRTNPCVRTNRKYRIQFFHPKVLFRENQVWIFWIHVYCLLAETSPSAFRTWNWFLETLTMFTISSILWFIYLNHQSLLNCHNITIQ